MSGAANASNGALPELAAPDLPAEIAQVLLAKCNVSRETLPKLEAYAALLVKWQKTINLVSNDSLPGLWTRHFLDSAQLYPLLPAPRPLKLFDLGSGAGFPGLVLAAIAAGNKAPIEAHLIESDRRKAAFLGQVAGALGLSVRVHAKRIENTEKMLANVVTARALAPLSDLLEISANFCGPETILVFPKGEKAAAELTAAERAWKMEAELKPSLSDSRGSIILIRKLARR